MLNSREHEQVLCSRLSLMICCPSLGGLGNFCLRKKPFKFSHFLLDADLEIPVCLRWGGQAPSLWCVKAVAFRSGMD